MKKINLTYLLSLLIGLMVWGFFLLFQTRPSLFIDMQAQEMTDSVRKQFILCRNIFWGMGVFAFLGMILGVLDLIRQKRDKNIFLFPFVLTITGGLLCGCFFIIELLSFFKIK